MGSKLALSTALLISLLAACTVGADDAPTTSESITDKGRLVVVDGGGDIVTMDPDGTGKTHITDDGESARYFQPVWSPAGRQLAWSVADAAGFAIGVADGDGSGRSRIGIPDFAFYSYWSPVGGQIGILHNGTSGNIDFELVDPASATSSILDSGSPYYFSWSPEGDAIAVHVGGDRLEIFDESAIPTDIGPADSRFLAPHWTDEGIFYLGPDGVTLRDNATQLTVLARPPGFVSINPNRRGTLVAVHSTNQEGGITASLRPLTQSISGGVSVIDVETGEASVATDAIAVGSFWSPDGRRLLILAVDPDGTFVDLLVWQDGETEHLVSMRLPTSVVSEALAFFDQYAQSWQVWSPDSSTVVFPGSIDGESGIWVIPVGGGEPIRVSDGGWAAWSHG